MFGRARLFFSKHAGFLNLSRKPAFFALFPLFRSGSGHAEINVNGECSVDRIYNKIEEKFGEDAAPFIGCGTFLCAGLGGVFLLSALFSWAALCGRTGWTAFGITVFNIAAAGFTGRIFGGVAAEKKYGWLLIPALPVLAGCTLSLFLSSPELAPSQRILMCGVYFLTNAAALAAMAFSVFSEAKFIAARQRNAAQRKQQLENETVLREKRRDDALRVFDSITAGKKLLIDSSVWINSDCSILFEHLRFYCRKNGAVILMQRAQFEELAGLDAAEAGNEEAAVILRRLESFCNKDLVSIVGDSCDERDFAAFCMEQAETNPDIVFITDNAGLRMRLNLLLKTGSGGGKSSRVCTGRELQYMASHI